jgi:hypothetical protein
VRAADMTLSMVIKSTLPYLVMCLVPFLLLIQMEESQSADPTSPHPHKGLLQVSGLYSIIGLCALSDGLTPHGVCSPTNRRRPRWLLMPQPWPSSIVVCRCVTEALRAFFSLFLRLGVVGGEDR